MYARGALRGLYSVSAQLGIPAFIIGGGFSRPFWNGKFGPHQLSTDVDVLILYAEDTLTVEKELGKQFPSYRWSVHGSIRRGTANQAGVTHESQSERDIETLRKAVTNEALTFRCGGVRMTSPTQTQLLLKLGA